MLERRPCSRSELYMNTRNLELRGSGVLVQDGLPGSPLFDIALMVDRILVTRFRALTTLPSRLH